MILVRHIIALVGLCAIHIMGGGLAGAAVHPEIDPEVVVLGYVQKDTPCWGYRWQDLTHVALPAIDFDTSGTLDTSYLATRNVALKPNGVADAYGVKVLLTVRNKDFDAAVLEEMMPDTEKRAALVRVLAGVINNPADNIAGVSLDFEPLTQETAATNSAIVSFILELRAALLPGKIITWFVGTTYSDKQFSVIANCIAAVDFFNFGSYPWNGPASTTIGAIAPRPNYTSELNKFFAAGVPAEKTVLVLPAYGYSWFVYEGGYPVAVKGPRGTIGYSVGKFEALLLGNYAIGKGYNAQDVVNYFSGGNLSGIETTVWDDENTLRTKMQDALHWPGPEHTGAKLRGVGFWSLMWMAQNYPDFRSRDHDGNPLVTVPKTRTYPQIYQTVQELFHPQNSNAIILEKWESDDSILTPEARDSQNRWRSPAEGPDGVGVDSSATSIAVVPLPDPVGAPANSDRCQKINFGFTAAANNRMLYRWEILGHDYYRSIVDRLATCGFFDATREVRLDVYSPEVKPGCAIRMVVMDANRELEMGPLQTLDWTGWKTIRWNLSAAPPIGYATKFNQYVSGNGVLNVPASDKKNLSFIGILITGGGANVSGAIYLDELRTAAPTPFDDAWMVR